MNGSRYVAIDLGAESGRVVVGTLLNGRVDLAEAFRFANAAVRTPEGLHWDVLRLYHDVLAGVRAAAREHGGDLTGMGVDTWAVDYGLVDGRGRLLGNPYHYRDGRTDGIREQVAHEISSAEQYACTGIAQLPFNTLYQLVAARRNADPCLDLANALLLIPDLLHFWLTGEMVTEHTNASTTGTLGTNGEWLVDWLARLDVPGDMLLPPTHAGTVLGRLRPALCSEWDLPSVPVILPATHDTACAVIAVPLDNGGIAAQSLYISSGTWSLVGVELDRPVLTEEARLAGFTNERGIHGTYRFLTNVMGLWLVQESRRSWARSGQEWDYEELTAAAAARPPSGLVVDVDNPTFLHPADMPTALAAHLASTGQKTVEDPVALVRVVLEGLALKYRWAMLNVEQFTGARVRTIHIVGGGARNRVLCQLTADATGRTVLAGPVEATSLGNVLSQAMGRGEVGSVEEARAIARDSAGLEQYEPRDMPYWDEAYGRLLSVRQSGLQVEERQVLNHGTAS